MKKNVQKAMWKSLGWNLLAGLLAMVPFLLLQGDAMIGWGFILLVGAPLSLLIQLVIAIVHTTRPEKQEAGQGMLISLGIIILIGLAVCTPFWI
jgi:hypothetical protein